MTKIISFATQKGGGGKTTLVLALAAPLAVEYGLKIAVVDCDYQQSIARCRKQMDEANLEQLRELHPEVDYPYNVYSVALNKLTDFLDNLEVNYDLIILDLPGRADGDDIFDALTSCDVVFVPLVSDYLDRSSTAEFMSILHSIKTAADKDKIGFNYYGISTKRTNRREEEEMDDYVDQLGLSRFKSSLGLRVAYTRGSTLYSLLNPSYLRYAGGDKVIIEEIRAVCDEIIEKLGLQPQVKQEING